MDSQLLEAEQSVLGAMLLDPRRVVAETVGALSEADFGMPGHGAVFAVIRALFVDGTPIDAITVGNRLGEDGAALLARCVTATPTAANFRQYVDIVRRGARIRRAKEKLAPLIERLNEGDVEASQAAAVGVCEELSYTERDTTLSAADGILQFCEVRSTPKTYIKTGIERLDKYTALDRGDFVVVSGRPSSGKTAFTLQLARHMAQSVRVVYFSLETSVGKLMDRLVANVMGIPLTRIKRGNMEDRHWDIVARDMSAFGALHLYLVEAAGWTVPQIKAKAVQLSADVIFVDYLGLVRSEGRSLYERVTAVSGDLHTMAQQGKFLVVALSQLSRAGQGEPDMTSLRESGAIEQDADVILLLHKKEDEEEHVPGEPERRRLILAKNKEGITGAMDCKFYGETQRFCAAYA